MHQSCRTFGNLTKEIFLKKTGGRKHCDFMQPSFVKSPSEMSVLIPLLEVNSKPSVLFTKRSIHLKSQSNGKGRIYRTTLRETHEEIGVEPKSVELWGHLKPVFTRTMTSTVVPIVGCIGLDALRSERVNRREVQTLFSVPLEELCRSTGYTRFLSKKFEYTLPVFFSRNFTVISHNSEEFLPREFRIWGLSAIMLHQLLLIIAPESYQDTLRMPFY
ncbi:hydrolase, NUDIX family [Cooperia oncophora]